MNNLTFGIISDIHGDIDNLKAALNQCNQHKCDYILLLGDLLNHGPRNGLPSKYSPIEIVEELNKHKHKIISIKGNCDSEVDQMLLNFPIKSIYNQLFIGKHRIFMTHGHKYNETNMNELNLNKDDIFVYGHTHITKLEKNKDDIIVFNPGSISFPKQSTLKTMGIISENKISLITIDGELVKEYSL
jgi:putative phosphoesterase